MLEATGEESFMGSVCSNGVVGQTGAGKAPVGGNGLAVILLILQLLRAGLALLWRHDRGSAQNHKSLHKCLGCTLKRKLMLSTAAVIFQLNSLDAHRS